ncbi:type VI secretion system Vgr family protein [Paracoccus saliphilus]|uniref:Type VI secretion system secreted protein VgrG n=1 Tax=Paracoccus saliphilus TaxID=405559 RepID=A0AA46A4S1_9RHOB|nr:type VI secretion system tip protein TssI/VgrG [Paracoccus saliphilus]WCR02056.1 type VI secretion system tip protein VgrG [Paracoccus saliphilus]SIS67033.1 type VI secretion system secreted protein VgrG [Paracoccus saliphilus]
MNAPFKQAERLGRLTTALGKDILVLLRFEGTEYLNDLFEFRVDALATRDDLDFDKLLGTHATVEIEAHDEMRPFDGIVTQARWNGAGENGHRYSLTLRPWFWLAGKRRNQRIFHDKSVDQIVREVLADYGHLGDPALEIKLANEYPKHEYVVQYGESDLDFIRRQLERHGISFHFRHAMGSHSMVLTDDELNHPLIGERPFKPADRHHNYDQEHFWEWSPERNITTGAIKLTDYNFKHPDMSMEAARTGDAIYPEGRIEAFDYPGDFLRASEVQAGEDTSSERLGKDVARMRTQQERGADHRNRAVGDCVSLSAGLRVKLGGDKVPGHGETYLCLSATHSFVSEAYGSGGQESDGYSYSGAYTLMPDTAPMVPPKRTPQTRIHGPQTAMVVGESEIDCDEYGRILVQFHWDLKNAYSMRCRVSQNWSGNGWGGMVIPRIGMEVVVEFLEGDPDKPLVTGCVYNGKNKVPYELPRHKTRSTFRTDTHQGDGFNELRFEDEKDKEEIFVHAQKDRNEKTNNNHTERIDNNWVQSVGNHKVIEVDGNHDETVHGNVYLHVGPSGIGRTLNDAYRKFVEGISDIAAKLPIPGVKQLGRGVYSLVADQAINEATAGVKSQFIGVTKTVNVGSTITEQAGHSYQIVSGSHVSIDSGDVMAFTSNGEFQARVGKTELRMTSDGFIRLSGDTLYLDFSNGIEILGGNEISAKASKINLN